MHIASKTDINESFEIGKEAVRSALNNQTGKMMSFKRIHNHPYQIEIHTVDVKDVANLEKKILHD